VVHFDEEFRFLGFDFWKDRMKKTMKFFRLCSLVRKFNIKMARVYCIRIRPILQIHDAKHVELNHYLDVDLNDIEGYIKGPIQDETDLAMVDFTE